MSAFGGLSRSELMARIRGTGNKKTELRMILLFRSFGIKGWRRGSKLTGRPVFVFPREHLAVFVDGCFWHGCPRHFKEPTSNVEFWRKKIAVNRMRDRRVTRTLCREGWTVIRIWEHALRKTADFDRVAARFKKHLVSQKWRQRCARN
jgi:DNA mismatch endonuclease (patch repair protein)